MRPHELLSVKKKKEWTQAELYRIKLILRISFIANHNGYSENVS